MGYVRASSVFSSRVGIYQPRLIRLLYAISIYVVSSSYSVIYGDVGPCVCGIL